MEGRTGESGRPVESRLFPLSQLWLLGSHFSVVALVREVMGIVAYFVKSVSSSFRQIHSRLILLLLFLKHFGPPVLRLPPSWFLGIVVHTVSIKPVSFFLILRRVSF
jgi:hypothetical protein